MSASVLLFGRYEFLAKLGSGGFGSVFHVRDTLLGREIALKTLSAQLSGSIEDRQRFVAEARALASLQHPNIVTVYDVGEDRGQPYFTMELVRGDTLGEILRREGLLPLNRVANILASLTSAIDHVHTTGLVHRDVKPTNVMINSVGCLKLMDFGIARDLSRPALTQTGMSLGTLENASPEQVRGERAGPAADIYGLGILAYQLLAGRPPFTGDTAHIVYAQVHLPPPPLQQLVPSLPLSVYSAVNRALAKFPSDRPSTGAMFLQELMGDSTPAAFTPLRDAGRNPAIATTRSQPSNSPREVQETHIAEIKAMYFGVGGAIATNGTIRITNRRIVFTPKGLSFKRRQADIPFTSIGYIAKERFHLSNCAVVHTRSGESHVFYPSEPSKMSTTRMIALIAEIAKVPVRP